MKGNYYPDFNRQSNLLDQSQAEDSLDDFEQQPKQYTVPAPQMSNNNHHIELTFKKSHLQQHFSYSNDEQVKRSLFTESERFLIKNLQHPISSYYKMPIDQLSQLPFADLYSLQLSNKQKQKLVLVGDILELKRVRMKSKIVKVNQTCLNLKQNISYQQKKKLFLMDLLVKQLSKKQLIETLRLNWKLRKFLREFGDQSNKEQQFSNPQIYRQDLLKEQQHIQYKLQKEQMLSREDKSQQEEDLSKDEQDIDKSSIRDKIWIMSQTVSSIIMKTLFLSFNSICNHSKKSQRTVIPKLPSGSFEVSPIKQFNRQVSLKSQQLISQQRSLIQPSALTLKVKQRQQNEEQNEEVQEQVQEGGYSQAQNEDQNISQTRIQLQRLQDYIDELLEQCSQTNDLQKRYFIKWKVYLLEKIAMSILTRANVGQQEQENSNSEAQNEQQQPSIREEQDLGMKSRNQKSQAAVQKPKTQLSIIQGWSRATSQLSQGQSGLKEEKNEVKSFLYKTYTKQFLSLLKNNSEQRQIKKITAQVYTQKMLQKAFTGLKINLQSALKLKQLDYYFQQVAENQNEDVDLPFYFWKTSQLHKYFKFFKQNSRNIKILRIFTSFTKRNAFKLLFYFSTKQLRQDEKINKWVLLKEKKGLFRIFNAWKQEYKSNYCYSNKVKGYIRAKEKEMLNYYFSVLKLEYKRHLVAIHRADKYYSFVLKGKIFSQMKTLTEEGQQFREKEKLLAQYLYLRNAGFFIQNFQQYFHKYIEYQRLVVKQARLKKQISDNLTVQCLRNWRAKQLRNSAYAAIEDKLIRFHNKKKKREIMKIWIKKALQRRSSDSEKSDKHKQWLLKYYNGLCSVAPY